VYNSPEVRYIMLQGVPEYRCLMFLSLIETIVVHIAILAGELWLYYIIDY